ncbi:MAG: hypothetical protein Q9185_000063 [Variospora sp. 1 TL-2023]
MTGVDLDPALNFSRRNSIANAGQMGTKQHRAARWFRAERAEVRKPKRISEWELDMVFLRWKAEDDDETLRSALPKVDPPLYDNIKDKMRQVAVELCLLRSRIAYSMQNWDEMEIRSQQAYNLAADLQWEPFKAKCALPLGVALYQQGKWEGAYENFLEALNTGEFYGPRSVIQKWINLVTERRLRERAMFMTPLDSVVEEEEVFSFPRRQDRNLESRDPPSLHHSLQVAEYSTRDTALPRTSEAHSSSAPLKQVTQAVLTGVTRYTGYAADGSTTDRVLDGPAVITVSTDPNPASFGSPRLYNPKAGPAPSPPMRAETPPLRPALFLPRTLAASSLSEMELPPQYAQKVRKGDPSSEPGQGALLQDGPQEDDRQPLKPSSLLTRTERSPQLSPSRQYSGRKSDVVPIQQSQALSPLEQADSEIIPPVSSLPSRLKPDELRNLSMVLEHYSFTSPFRETGSEARPTTQSPPSHPIAIATQHPKPAWRSPTASPPPDAQPSPPYPPRPVWSTGLARPSPPPAAAGTGSTYAATSRPRNKRAISDGHVYGKRFEMRRPRRSSGYMGGGGGGGGGGVHPLSQGSSPVVEKKKKWGARSGSTTIRWADQWVGGEVAVKEGTREEIVKGRESGEKEDVVRSEGGSGGEVIGEGSESGGSEESEDASSEDGGVPIGEDNKGRG